MTSKDTAQKSAKATWNARSFSAEVILLPSTMLVLTGSTKANKSELVDEIILEEPAPGAHKTCPFHKDLLALRSNMETNDIQADKGLGVMDRFVGEDASKQSAVVAVAGGKDGLNISKGCKCHMAGDKGTKASL